ncbi:MAG: hypothetical protein QOG43_915 [Actinomycetota bacterium]|jgi:hypothetical protein|nr:hypothetical protein [Actinomycetota bacterium]
MRDSGDQRLLRDSSPEEEGIPDLEGDPEGMVLAGDDDDDMIVPRDYPVAALDFGVTAAEQERGESLAARVRREEPDFWEQNLSEDDRIAPGRLVQPDEGQADVDDVAEEVGFATDDIYGLSAEEEAVRIESEDDPVGLGLGDGTPGYLSDEDD